MKASHFLLLTSLALVGTAACSGGDTGTNSGGSGGGSGGSDTAGSSGSAGTSAGAAGSGASSGSGGSAGTAGSGAASAGCTMPAAVPCEDQVILDMNLQKDPAPGAITSTGDAKGWLSNVDATAGGPFAPTPDSYVYGKFSADGLTKVEIGDEASLSSMDWDIAFRRYVVRINSGNSGPSCVQAAPAPGGPKYEEVTAVPEDPSYHADLYFTDTCEFIPDGSGLENSPATALSGYWTYPGCVKMTDQVFIVALASGKHVKFIIDDYYKPDVQEQCDTTGMVPASGSGSANFVVRWAFLD